MGRTGALGVLGAAVLVVGALLRGAWPDAAPALACPPAQVRVDGAGVARCTGPGEAPPAATASALGARADLNAASEEALARVPGVGRRLAQALVAARAARPGGFATWEDVDAVPGVGPARLRTLRAVLEVRPPGQAAAPAAER